MRPLLIVLLVLLIGGCKRSSKIPDNFDYGIVEQGVYKNAFFDMEIPLIQGWDVQSKEEMDQLMEKGADEIGERDKKLASAVRASQVTTAKLLIMFKYPVGAPDTNTYEFNSSFVLMAENIGTRFSIKTGTDYLDELKKTLLKARPEYVASPYYSTRKMGDRKFDVLRVSINAGGETVTQLYCCTLEKGFALVAILSFATDQQEEELTNMLRKIKLK